MEVKIVLGYAFGDEGKGVTVQWLCKKAIEEGKSVAVVRFSGGPQAGHTVVNEGIEHICSSFGSGVLLGVPTYYTDDVFIDPIALYNERKVLQGKGIKETLVYASMFNRVITPYDVFAGREDNKVLSDGTCGMGIYPTFKRYNEDNGYGAWVMGESEHIKKVREYYEVEEDTSFEEQFIYCAKCVSFNQSNLSLYDVLIFEGSQGLLLDMDCGFYPHVTPSRVGLNGIPKKYLKGADVYLVTRSYLTRHGNGYEPKYKLEANLEKFKESNTFNEFQLDFKVGCLETGLLRRAAERHRLDNYKLMYNLKYNLVVTHTDVIVDSGRFDYMGEDLFDSVVEPTHETIATTVDEYTDLSYDRVFYNDSQESNLKQVR